MPAALEIDEIADEEFASPDLAVCSVPGAVERHANHFAFDSVIRHATRDVRVMVLHADRNQAGLLQRKTRAEITRVQVVRNRRRRYAEETLKMSQSFAEELESLQVFEIADMLAQNGIPVLRQAKRVFQFASACQNLGQRHRERNGIGRIAPRPAHGILALFKDLKDGIVHAGVNRPIVKEEMVGERVKPRPCVLIAAYDRFFTHVAAGHDKGLERFIEEHVMQRRVRQHHSKARISGRGACRYAGVFAMRSENDRPARSLEQRAIRGGQDAQPLGDCYSANHDRESLRAAAFAFAEKAYGTLVGGIADQMESAQSLDRENLPLMKKRPHAIEDLRVFVSRAKLRLRVRRKLLPGKKININTASFEELDALPGIGPVRAQAIIDRRPFKTIEDIKTIKGIKDVEFSKIHNMITVK